MSNRKHETSCPIANTLNVFAGKWKPEILWHLKNERMRFNALHRAIGVVSQKMMAQQLRELERDGLVKRIQLQTIPPHVEYEATDAVKTLEPIFEILENWYTENGAKVEKAQKKYDKQNPP